MTEDGVIFISIDDNEQGNLKLLCDEIFREDNVDTMIWRKSGRGRDGKMKNIAKEKGRKKALAHLVNKVVELGQNVNEHKIIIGHTDDIELANELKSKIIEQFGEDLDIDIVVVNPTCGSHCGPNTVGISFYSKRR